MIVRDRTGDILKQHGLASARWRDDQCALSLALGRDDIDHAGRLVLLRGVKAVERELLIGIERRQIVEIDAVADGVGLVEVDLCDPGQRELALAILGPADFAFARVAGAQAEFSHEIGRDVDVVRTGKVIGFRTPQEAEAVV